MATFDFSPVPFSFPSTMSWKPPSQYIVGSGGRRGKHVIIAVVASILILLLLPSVRQLSLVASLSPRNEADQNANYPPTYERLRNWERSLPQHDLSLPYPEGRNGRYVKFASQVQKLGWNNCLNEWCVSVDMAFLRHSQYDRFTGS
jgi:hypothetical protein